jgi:glycosyltransferase involved in cell wall biosynthesis
MGEGKGAASFFLAPQALLEAGHSVHISMPRGGEIPMNAAAERGEGVVGGDPRADTYHGMTLHRYGPAIEFMPMEENRILRHLARPSRYIYYLVLASLAGLRAARRCNPDVIVGYGAWAAPVAFFVARSMRLPNVTRLFGQSLPSEGGGGLRGAIRTALNYPEIAAFLTACSTLIVCDDGSGGDKVAARMGVAAERLLFWRNGVDKGLFCPPENRDAAKAELGIPAETPVILSVSRLDAEKHHERLIHAMPQLLKECPEATVIVLGEGPERAYLEAEAGRLGVSSYLRMPGAVSREELAAHYKACDLFVSLSDRTNIANPTLEAMCCGAAVIALDTGGTEGALAGGENAMIVSESELPGLGTLILGLLKDDIKRGALANGALDFAGKHIPSVEERSRMEADAVSAVVRPK